MREQAATKTKICKAEILSILYPEVRSLTLRKVNVFVLPTEDDLDAQAAIDRPEEARDSENEENCSDSDSDSEIESGSDEDGE